MGDSLRYKHRNKKNRIPRFEPGRQDISISTIYNNKQRIYLTKNNDQTWKNRINPQMKFDCPDVCVSGWRWPLRVMRFEFIFLFPYGDKHGSLAPGSRPAEYIDSGLDAESLYDIRNPIPLARANDGTEMYATTRDCLHTSSR